MKYLLYGANGYTAKLMIREALSRKHDFILAGRSRDKIEAVAKEYDLPFVTFALNDEFDTELAGVDAVVNAAGPFEKTARPLTEACIRNKVHYLDITGEISVFEALKKMDSEAKKAGIMILPGIGFDVVPTDCLASYLHEKLPHAESLQLVFTPENSGMSHGTASTAISQLGGKGYVRKGGRLEPVSIAHKSKEVDFGEVKRTVATIPWGDISTAYTSTGIPNIEVYTSMPKSAIRMMKLSWLTNPIMRTKFIKRLAQRWVDRNLDGPSEEQNEKGFSLLYGKVSKGEKTVEARLKCAEVYKFTALASCTIIDAVANGEFKPGYQTPSSAYGWELITKIEDSKFYEI